MDNATKALAEKVAELEAKIDGPQKRKPEAPKEPSLAECNAAYARAHGEIKAEKQDAANMAKKAIDDVFRGKRINQARPQKNVSAAAFDLAAKK